MTNFPYHTNNPDEDEEQLISKGQLKREAEAVMALALRLFELPKKHFAEITLDTTLREGLELARRLDNNNARKRQMRYVAKQINEENTPLIEAALEAIHQQSIQFRGRIAVIEGWCSKLIEGDKQLLEQLITDNPALDRQHLRQLIRQVNKDAAAGKPPTAQKKLFRYLQQATA